VNSIGATRGGTHVKLATRQIVKYLRAVLAKRTQKVTITPGMVQQYLFVFVKAMVKNPTFDSHVKETLISRTADFQGQCEFPLNQFKKLMKTSIPGLIHEFAKFKADSERKTFADLQRGRLHIVKPIEANKASKSQNICGSGGPNLPCSCRGVGVSPCRGNRNLVAEWFVQWRDIRGTPMQQPVRVGDSAHGGHNRANPIRSNVYSV
jgi:hypothetical protein